MHIHVFTTHSTPLVKWNVVEYLNWVFFDMLNFINCLKVVSQQFSFLTSEQEVPGLILVGGIICLTLYLASLQTDFSLSPFHPLSMT